MESNLTWHQDGNRIPGPRIRFPAPNTNPEAGYALPEDGANQDVGIEDNISTSQSFFAPAPLLEVGRNVLFTHTRKSRGQALGSRLELSKIRGLYAFARRGNIDNQRFSRRVTATGISDSR
jgi:hypothetical protein